MADDENEPDPVPASREPPPRAVTRLSPLVRRLVAPNASPFTFNGTCTYIVGAAKVAIVDPGPDDDAHLAALLAAVDGRAGRDHSHHPYPPRSQPGRQEAQGGDGGARGRRRAVHSARRRLGRPRFLT